MTTKTKTNHNGINVTNIDAGFPKKVLPLVTESAPIKVIYGGRASSKTTTAARALLLKGKQYPMRIICCREFDKANKYSMHKVLTDEIYALGLQDFYSWTDHTIRGKEVDHYAFPGYPIRQTEFIFMGIANNSQSIKSMQKPSGCWIEEAQNLTEAAWTDLEPTIRQELPNGEQPEIWLTFNPQYADDFVWEHFVLRQQPDSMVVEINYLDNPWVDKASKRQANRMKAYDYAKYENVWLGKPKSNFVGSIYEDYLADAFKQNRIRQGVDYDPDYRVDLYFDLGYSDMCAIWAAQRTDNGEIRIIDYYENKRKPASHYLDIMTHRGYPVAKWVLPHDGRQHSGPIPDSWEDVFRKAGKPVRVLKRQSITDGINAAREQFHKMVFDADRCQAGINCLRHYRYAEHKDGDKVTSKPVHDIFSNGADSFRALAIGFKHRETKPFPKYQGQYGHLAGRNDSWMSL